MDQGDRVENENDDNWSDFFTDTGDESDIEDNDIISMPSCTSLPKIDTSQLPDTVAVLETPHGSQVYLVGTAHFSEKSHEDVTRTIQLVRPDIVVLELCNSRVTLLHFDEATLLEEARNINTEKILNSIKQSGIVQGGLYILLLNISAHVTEQLGMAPGGEFRRALQEAKKIEGCRVHLGDRPIQVTLKRAFGQLSAWQKIKLVCTMIANSRESVSQEDVEALKDRDVLDELLKDMSKQYPVLWEALVNERDQYLAHSIRYAAQPIPNQANNGFVPSKVVAVIGMGHVSGIQKNWDALIDVRELMRVPGPSKVGTAIRWSFRAAIFGLTAYGSYRLFRFSQKFIGR